MKKSYPLKPQDVLILLKIVADPNKDKRITDLAREIEVSPSEVSQGLERLLYARLLQGNKREILRANVSEFIVHGAQYAFPAAIGSVVRGIATAHSAEPLNKKIISAEGDKYVWAFADGDERGQSVSPIYSSAPLAAKKDPKLYELLALFDALRIGRVREHKIAAEELAERILKAE